MLGWGGIVSLTFIKLCPNLTFRISLLSSSFVGNRTQIPAYASQLMSLMGLAEQTYVSCSRMWIPMAKTAESRILGQRNRKMTE